MWIWCSIWCTILMSSQFRRIKFWIFTGKSLIKLLYDLCFHQSAIISFWRRYFHILYTTDKKDFKWPVRTQWNVFSQLCVKLEKKWWWLFWLIMQLTTPSVMPIKGVLALPKKERKRKKISRTFNLELEIISSATFHPRKLFSEF